MLEIDESYLPVTLYIPSLTEAGFWELCQQYDDYRLEYTADGDLVIMALTDLETSVRNATLTWRLSAWASDAKRGVVTGSDAGFLLHNGARRSADAAWMTRARLRERPGCPQFVVELVSAIDPQEKVHEKMVEWLENGAELGWMIDPAQRTVSIYRPGQNVEVRSNIREIEGDGPVVGFVLDLRNIWDVAPYD